MASLKLYYFMILLLCTLLPACHKMKPAIPPLEETYRFNDKNPFGGYVAFQKVSEMFDNVKLVYGHDRVIDSDIQIHKEDGHHSLYFIITNRLYMQPEDVSWALNYVKDGNDLFISANEMNREFLRALEVETNQSIAFLEDKWGRMRDTKVNIFFGKDLPVLPFSFYYFPFNNHLRKYNKTESRVLGTDDRGFENFVILFSGKGRLYLHLAPRALGNYFLLTDKNIDYWHHILNYLRPGPVVVYWDEFYKRMKFSSGAEKPEKDKDFSTLGVIMNNTYLKWALLMAAAGLALFLFSNMKRKQRLVPRMPKTSNASVDFVETVARLYYVGKNNKNIANKLITYFYENVRSKYFLRHGDDRESFIVRLSGKKGMPEAGIRQLLQMISVVEKSENVSDAQLLDLNKHLENFYNHK